MPIYEYKCQQCDHELEKLQKISDNPLKTCPACQQDSLRKKVSAAGFRLKGSGWYETDFKNKTPEPGKVQANDQSADNSANQGDSEGATTKTQQTDNQKSAAGQTNKSESSQQQSSVEKNNSAASDKSKGA